MGIEAMSAALATHGLTAFYGDFQALFGIDFEIARRRDGGDHRRQRRGQVAPSSRRVTGLLRGARRERCVFDGRPIGGLPAAEIVQRGIAMVPEGRRLFPEPARSRRTC